MKLSKEHKILIGLLILSAGAIFVDRVIIGSEVTAPQQASAELVLARLATGHPPLSSALLDDALHPTGHDQPITNRLASAARLRGIGYENLKDAFKPSESWIKKPEPAAKPATPAAQNPKLLGEAFRTQNRLMAVIATNGQRYAVISNRKLNIGQTLDGFRLVSIQQHRVRFESHGIQVELTLTAP